MTTNQMPRESRPPLKPTLDGILHKYCVYGPDGLVARFSNILAAASNVLFLVKQSPTGDTTRHFVRKDGTDERWDWAACGREVSGRFTTGINARGVQ